MVLTAKGTDMGRWDVLGRWTAPSLNGQKEQFGDRLFGADSQFSGYILIRRGSDLQLVFILRPGCALGLEFEEKKELFSIEIMVGNGNMCFGGLFTYAAASDGKQVQQPEKPDKSNGQLQLTKDIRSNMFLWLFLHLKTKLKPMEMKVNAFMITLHW